MKHKNHVLLGQNRELDTLGRAMHIIIKIYYLSIYICMFVYICLFFRVVLAYEFHALNFRTAPVSQSEWFIYLA